MRKLAYHGTLQIEKVLQEGIRGYHSECPCNCIWLARRPEDAAIFGDVIEVDMTGIPGDISPNDWQGTFPNGYLGPERLRRYSQNLLCVFEGVNIRKRELSQFSD